MQRVQWFTNHWPPITNHCQPLPTIGRPLVFIGWQWFSCVFTSFFQDNYQKQKKTKGFHWLVTVVICFYYVFEVVPTKKLITNNAYGLGLPPSPGEGGGGWVEAIGIGFYGFVCVLVGNPNAFLGSSSRSSPVLPTIRPRSNVLVFAQLVCATPVPLCQAGTEVAELRWRVLPPQFAMRGGTSLDCSIT